MGARFHFAKIVAQVAMVSSSVVHACLIKFKRHLSKSDSQNNANELKDYGRTTWPIRGTWAATARAPKFSVTCNFTESQSQPERAKTKQRNAKSLNRA